MACSLPTKTARSGMEHNAKFKEAWWKDEQLQNKRKKITPKNDPYDFCRRPTTEDTPDYGGPPLERRVTAMSISIEPDSQEPTKVTHSNTEALNTTENTDAKNYIYSSVSKVISGISESDTCSTCSKHKQKLIGSFIHPVFPQFPSWESSSRPRARRRRAEKQHKTEDSHGDNRKEDKNKNKEHGKFRATLSRIPHAIEERLARIEQKCKDAREHVKKTMEVLRREPPDREYTSTGGSYNRSRSPTLKRPSSHIVREDMKLQERKIGKEIVGKQEEKQEEKQTRVQYLTYLR
ncbi:hypothetical protein QBC45DRAFT_433335 [Copromyces sp. CBS 386.78]|nr:hypothetical protein QBC45DRAFT_433335 [Copromyces sp. CBS 386.78]